MTNPTEGRLRFAGVLIPARRHTSAASSRRLPRCTTTEATPRPSSIRVASGDKDCQYNAEHWEQTIPSWPLRSRAVSPPFMPFGASCWSGHSPSSADPGRLAPPVPVFIGSSTLIPVSTGLTRTPSDGPTPAWVLFATQDGSAAAQGTTVHRASPSPARGLYDEDGDEDADGESTSKFDVSESLVWRGEDDDYGAKDSGVERQVARIVEDFDRQPLATCATVGREPGTSPFDESRRRKSTSPQSSSTEETSVVIVARPKHPHKRRRVIIEDDSEEDMAQAPSHNISQRARVIPETAPSKRAFSPSDALPPKSPTKRRSSALTPSSQPDRHGRFERSTCHQCRLPVTLPKMVCNGSLDSKCSKRFCRRCLLERDVYLTHSALSPSTINFHPGATFTCPKCLLVCPCAPCRRRRAVDPPQSHPGASAFRITSPPSPDRPNPQQWRSAAKPRQSASRARGLKRPGCRSALNAIASRRSDGADNGPYNGRLLGGLPVERAQREAEGGTERSTLRDPYSWDKDSVASETPSDLDGSGTSEDATSDRIFGNVDNWQPSIYGPRTSIRHGSLRPELAFSRTPSEQELKTPTTWFRHGVKVEGPRPWQQRKARPKRTRTYSKALDDVDAIYLASEAGDCATQPSCEHSANIQCQDLTDPRWGRWCAAGLDADTVISCVAQGEDVEFDQPVDGCSGKPLASLTGAHAPTTPAVLPEPTPTSCLGDLALLSSADLRQCVARSQEILAHRSASAVSTAGPTIGLSYPSPPASSNSPEDTTCHSRSAQVTGLRGVDAWFGHDPTLCEGFDYGFE